MISKNSFRANQKSDLFQPFQCFVTKWLVGKASAKNDRRPLLGRGLVMGVGKMNLIFVGIMGITKNGWYNEVLL